MNLSESPGARMWRYSFLEWIWTAVAFALYASSLLVPAVVAFVCFRTFGVPGVCLFIPAGFLMFLSSLVVLTGVLRGCLPQVRCGAYPLLHHPELTRWLVQYSVHNFLRLPGWIPMIQSNPLLRSLYRHYHCRSIHPTVRASYDSLMLDPYLVSIGEGSKIGAFTKIVGHYSDDEKFVIGDIRIGRNVLIGGESIIGPNVSIGDGAVVEARSSLLPGTTIPSNEIWGGSPARFRKRKNGIGELV